MVGSQISPQHCLDALPNVALLCMIDAYVAALLRSPDGELIEDRTYYAFSSVFFYTNRSALLLNGRRVNLSYGSYAPRAPNVFIDDSQFKELWSRPVRYYLVTSRAELPRLEAAVGRDKLNVVVESGGKYLFTNRPMPDTNLHTK